MKLNLSLYFIDLITYSIIMSGEKEKMRAYKREYARKRRQEDPEYLKKCRENSRRYHYKNKDARLAASRDWKVNNNSSQKEYRKLFYQRNKDAEKVNNQIWIKNNLEKYKKIKSESDKKWRENNSEKLKLRRSTKEYKEKRNARARERHKNDIQYAIDKRLRNLLNQAIRLYSGTKQCSVDKLIGCSIQDLKNYLESLFKDGMNWNNKHLWHIDHILPCSSFDLTNIVEQQKCFHYTNLQPLWAKENLMKSNKIKKQGS